MYMFKYKYNFKTYKLEKNNVKTLKKRLKKIK